MYKLGIIGFGVVGKSVLSFLQKYNDLYAIIAARRSAVIGDLAPKGQTFGPISIWDKRILEAHEHALLAQSGANLVDGKQVNLGNFIDDHDFVLVSPGVDVGLYAAQHHKILTELDFFAAFFKKPVVAITGSVGKTTVTRLLGALTNMLPVSSAKAGAFATQGDRLRTVIGGNVGIGMLDLISSQDVVDAAIVELSSFQLEFNRCFAPAIAIYTNLYPNHLDRHKTLEAYWHAKAAMMRLQRTDGITIVSYELFTGPIGALVARDFATISSRIIVTADRAIDATMVALAAFELLYVHNNSVILGAYKNHELVAETVLISDISFPAITFISNWLQIVAALYVMGLAVEQLPALLASADVLPDLAHRMRHFATVRGVDFYDDSKSTIAQATLAAVQRLAAQGRPIRLILGGLGKGIDRSWLMPALAAIPQLKQVYCFGPESDQFPGAMVYETLPDVVAAVGTSMVAGDIVLFSPSGTSFDFFKNYEHRGQVFEQLVQKLA